MQKDVCLESGGIKFDTVRREAYAKGKMISLTRKEKIGQLVQVPGDALKAQGQELGVRDELGIDEEMMRNVGST